LTTLIVLICLTQLLKNTTSTITQNNFGRLKNITYLYRVETKQQQLKTKNKMKRLSLNDNELELLFQSVNRESMRVEKFIEFIKTDEKYIQDFPERKGLTYEDFVSRQEQELKTLNELSEKIGNKIF